MRNLEDKVKTKEEFFKVAAKLKRQGRTLVQCDGVFDIVHPGHIESFLKARKFGDILYVALVADEYVDKGRGRPLFKTKDRAVWVAAIEAVDFVVINPDYGPLEIIKQVKPNVMVKGESYIKKPTQGFLADKAAVESFGGRVEFVPEPVHSTEIIKKIYQIFD